MDTTTSLRHSPHGTVYLVLEDFGQFGRVYRETDPTQADLETVLAALVAGQYERPLRIVAFNIAEGWARDVSLEIAEMVLTRTGELDQELASTLREFAETVR